MMAPALRYAERVGRSWREARVPLEPLPAAVELGEDTPCSLSPVQHAHLQTEPQCVRDSAAAVVTGTALADRIDAQDTQGMGMGAGRACAAGNGLSRQPVQQAVHCARTHDGFAHAHTFVVGAYRASEVQDTMQDMRSAGSSAGGACAARGSAGSPRLDGAARSEHSFRGAWGRCSTVSFTAGCNDWRQKDRQTEFEPAGRTVSRTGGEGGDAGEP